MDRRYGIIVTVLLTILFILGVCISMANAMGYDQLDHYFMGTATDAGLERLGFNLRDRFFIITAVGILKERYDETHGGNFNVEDIEASILGITTWELSRNFSISFRKDGFKALWGTTF